MVRQWLSDPLFWKYASIPFVAAVVGWATNWVAVKMTFEPLEFVGRRPWLGWQGIIPSKATKMATIFVDTSMARLGRLAELFEHLEPERIAEHISDSMAPELKDMTDEILAATQPELWERLPEVVKTGIYLRVHDKMPEVVDGLVREIGEQIEELVDMKLMVVGKLEGDKALLNRLFLESGEKEFRFIIRSGFHFGFVFGLVQLAVWILLPAWWVLPLFGLLVGYATNWIALNLIFRPLHPRRIGPWTVQGLFLRRQPEVAAVWCRIVTREIITVRNLVAAIFRGARADQARGMIRKRMKPLVGESLGLAKPVAELAVGPEVYSRIRRSVAEKAVDVSTRPFDDRGFNEERAAVIERFLRRRMEDLPAEQFQDLLRPCFQEDEMKLILLGAALGLAAGFAQLFLVFGGIGG